MKKRAYSGRETSNMQFSLKYYEYFYRKSCLQLRKNCLNCFLMEFVTNLHLNPNSSLNQDAKIVSPLRNQRKGEIVFDRIRSSYRGCWKPRINTKWLPATAGMTKWSVRMLRMLTRIRYVAGLQISRCSFTPAAYHILLLMGYRPFRKPHSVTLPFAPHFLVTISQLTMRLFYLLH